MSAQGEPVRKRQRRRLKFLRTRLGRMIRDIRRKTEDDAALKEIFAIPLTRAAQVRSQQQRQRGWKLYSLHAPEVECIAKSLSSGLTRGARPTSPTSSAATT